MHFPEGVRQLIRLALDEDWGRGDVTSYAVPLETTAQCRIMAKNDCVVSGIGLVKLIVQISGIDAEWVELHSRDGARVRPGQDLALMRGNARDLLGIERTIMNFLQRTCGIATLAAKYRERIGDSKVRVVDTRKTVPGWRFLDKKAVRDGGLWNHRFGLDSGVLIKENHIRAAGGIQAAIERIQTEVPHGVRVEVEVTSESEAFQVLECGVNYLLLDNFPAERLQELVPRLRENRNELTLEASGNVNLTNLDAYLNAGVDLISVGALTHSPHAADLSMQFRYG